MHFKNGREAQNGDPVITRNYDGKIVTGQIFNLREAETCNCDVAVLIPGGTTVLTCQNVGSMYHAEDGFHALESIESMVPKQVTSEAPAPVAPAPGPDRPPLAE